MTRSIRDFDLALPLLMLWPLSGNKSARIGIEPPSGARKGAAREAGGESGGCKGGGCLGEDTGNP